MAEETQQKATASVEPKKSTTGNNSLTNRDAVYKIVEEQIDKYHFDSQYGVARLPYHAHTGVDSPNISFTSLIDRTIFNSFTIPGTSAATDTNYSIFFIAPFACTLLEVREVHAVLGTDAGAVTLQVEKLTGTTAPGAGTVLLSTAVNLKAVINTVVVPVLVPLKSSLNLAVNDRLAFVAAGVLTAVANVTVSIVLGF